MSSLLRCLLQSPIGDWELPGSINKWQPNLKVWKRTHLQANLLASREEQTTPQSHNLWTLVLRILTLKIWSLQCQELVISFTLRILRLLLRKFQRANTTTWARPKHLWQLREASQNLSSNQRNKNLKSSINYNYPDSLCFVFYVALGLPYISEL